jgi:hypothetical protein
MHFTMTAEIRPLEHAHGRVKTAKRALFKG